MANYSSAHQSQPRGRSGGITPCCTTPGHSSRGSNL